MDPNRRSILDALMQVETFLRFDLPRSLAGSDGHLEPQREWAPFVEGYKLVRAKRACLLPPERQQIESMFDEAQSNLNALADLLRRVAESRKSGANKDSHYLPEVNGALARARDDFAARIEQFEQLVSQPASGRDPAAEETITREAIRLREPRNAEKIFIVHGHDLKARRALSDFLRGLGKEPLVLAELPSGGRTIVEKFEHYAKDVQYAVVLLTPDDVGGVHSSNDLRNRARQNVVFELGFFIGRLGRGRVCLMCTHDLELPSDLSGVVYVPLDPESKWGWSLVREFLHAEIGLDAGAVAHACQRLLEGQ